MSQAPRDRRRLDGLTDLLQQWSHGDGAALDRLMALVYEELGRLAEHHLRGERPSHTLSGGGLVHEVYLRLERERGLDFSGGRKQFFGLAGSVMRQVLVDHARSRRAAKRGSGEAPRRLDTACEHDRQMQDALAVVDDTIDLIALDQALRRLQALDPQQARVVELRFFAGLDVDTTAQALGLSATTVKREWATARAWLLNEIGADASFPR